MKPPTAAAAGSGVDELLPPRGTAAGGRGGRWPPNANGGHDACHPGEECDREREEVRVLVDARHRQRLAHGEGDGHGGGEQAERP